MDEGNLEDPFDIGAEHLRQSPPIERSSMAVLVPPGQTMLHLTLDGP